MPYNQWYMIVIKLKLKHHTTESTLGMMEDFLYVRDFWSTIGSSL